MHAVADSLIVPQCLYRPGSFTGLMTLYESNYIKLVRLIEPLAVPRPKRLAPAVSVSPEDCDLHLKLVASERYTSTLKLTYWFEDGQGQRVADPDLMVRVYHDARLVEAVRAADAHYHHLTDDVIAGGKMRYAGGKIPVPSGPGLGVELDRAGRVPVTPELTLPGRQDVFVVGDLALFKQGGEPVPGDAAASFTTSTNSMSGNSLITSDSHRFTSSN